MIKQAELSIKDESIFAEVQKVLESGIFINGPYNQKFNQLWAETCGTQYSLGVSSGSAALKTVLKFFKKRNRTNYAIIPNFSFAATLYSVMEAGYTPIFCPVDSKGLMNQEFLVDIVGKQEVSAIIPVHIYGQLQKLDITTIRTYTDSPIIEDACQVHGGLTSLQGDVACFSFYPSKNLGTIGDGGAIVTNNQTLYNWARQYINYGNYPEEKYVHSMQGDNLRLDEIKAAVLCKKLENLILENFRRDCNAITYREEGITSFVQEGYNVYHLFPVLFEDRKKAMDIFKKEGIEVGNHYPYTLHSLAEQSYFPHPKECKAKRIADHVVTLPIGPHLTAEELQTVIKVVHSNFQWKDGWFC